MSRVLFVFFFFFNDTATTEIYTLSLHDALPICLSLSKHLAHNLGNLLLLGKIGVFHNRRNAGFRRSEERFSRNAETDLVCRLLLEKKKRHLSVMAPDAQLHTVRCLTARLVGALT